MANCPKCGRKLRLLDWKPECPKCGVNLNYYNANEKLLADSEKAEIEHAHFQPKVDRAKAAYAGSVFAVLRIVFTLLPAAALFLPLAVFSGSETKKADVLAIYKYISKADLSAVVSSGAFGVSLMLLAVSVVLILVCEILIIASLGKHGKGRTAGFYIAMAAAAAASAVCFIVYSRGGSAMFPQYDHAAVGVGGWLYVALQLFSCGWCIFVLVRGIPVKYTPCIIGGLPSDEYFSYVAQGLSVHEIRRKMLVKLTELQLRASEAQNDREEEVRS